MLKVGPTRKSWALVVITFLAASGCGQAGGGGSGGSGPGGGSSDGGRSPDGEQFCPLGFSAGEACDTPGDSCSTGADECGGGPLLTCNQDHVWVETYDPKCCATGEEQLAYPDCPALLPTAGTACIVCVGALPCTYTVDVGCGNREAAAECDQGTRTWTVQTPQCG